MKALHRNRPPNPPRLSRQEARIFALQAQGLDRPRPFGGGMMGALATIEHLGYVQIDTISVVERAHHHVFWSRVSDFKPEHLADLVERRLVFEYWSHAASFLPMRDFRFSLPRKKLWRSRASRFFPPTPENVKLKKNVLARIRAEGPLLARNFDGPENRINSGWWDWKPAKRALEQLFTEGHLMISSRRGFGKVYDLTERVLPAGVDRRPPTVNEMADHIILTGLAAHGLMRIDELTHLRPALRTSVAKRAHELQREGRLEEISVEGLDRNYLALKGAWQNVPALAPDPGVRILSPFDNHVIRRERLRELFDFDYTIECYVPEAKRRFGYFSLPLLKDGKFVGRLDAKADRPNRNLLVRQFHCETTGRAQRRELWEQSQKALKEFAIFNGCEKITPPDRL